MTLRVVGDPRHGVPFGQDRLLPIWMATAFQMLGCPRVERNPIRSAADILTAFKLGTDGRQYTRLRERIERVFHATYFVEDHSRPDRISTERYQIMRRLELTISRRQKVNQWPLGQPNRTRPDLCQRHQTSPGPHRSRNHRCAQR